MLIDVSTMKGTGVFDIVTVGHLVIDTIFSPGIGEPRTTLGGPPTYVSVAAAKLGAKVSVISKVGDDFPEEYQEWLRNNNVDLSGLKRVRKASTTRFILEYKKWERKLRLEARAPPISPIDISDSLRSSIVHVAPVASEISSRVVIKLRKAAKVLSVDPQGFVRSFDEKWNASLKSWRESELLAHFDVFKSAVEEIQVVTRVQDLQSAMRLIGDYGVSVVLVTRGTKGAMLLFDNEFYDIPAFKSKTVVDPTGAGDLFIGAFLAEYERAKDILWCACVGSAAASFVVERVGPERFGERHEVYERAQGLYGKAVEK